MYCTATDLCSSWFDFASSIMDSGKSAVESLSLLVAQLLIFLKAATDYFDKLRPCLTELSEQLKYYGKQLHTIMQWYVTKNDLFLEVYQNRVEINRQRLRLLKYRRMLEEPPP